METLVSSHAKPLSAVVEKYGELWAEELISEWSSTRRFSDPEGLSREAWMGSLARLSLAFQKVGDVGASTAQLLLWDSWRYVSESIDRGLELSTPSYRQRTLTELRVPIAAILDGMSLVGAIELRDQAVRLLCGDERLTDCAIATLKASPAANCRSTGLDVIANHCSAVLESRLARPSRAPPTTGRSNSRQDVAASCAISCVTSSPIRPRQRSSGHSPRNAEPMCIAESTAPNCRSNTRPSGSDDPTPWC